MGSAGSFSRLNRKTMILVDVINLELSWKPKNLLVVGCGSGIEAATLACGLGCSVIGIDLETNFDPEAREFATLKAGDATKLEFPNGLFDVVYSYHALEHIHDDQKAVSEMKRVLKPNGLLCIGTPNRSRLIGYIGSEGTSFGEKLRWNLADWKARIRGRFRNEYGAHAGYTKSELQTILSQPFTDVRSITEYYYLKLYPSQRTLIKFLVKSGMSRFIFPSIYFLCR